MVSRTGEHIPASTLLTGYLCFIWEVPIAFFPPKKIYTLLILFLISFFRLSLMREKQLASLPLHPPLPFAHSTIK